MSKKSRLAHLRIAAFFLDQVMAESGEGSEDSVFVDGLLTILETRFGDLQSWDSFDWVEVERQMIRVLRVVSENAAFQRMTKRVES